MQETWVQFLVREDSAEQLSPQTVEAHVSRASAPQQEKPPQ